jgi:adenine-specific DNA methylase
MVTILEDLDVQQSIFLLFHVYSTFPNIRAQTRQSAQNARNRRVILPASRIDPIFFFSPQLQHLQFSISEKQHKKQYHPHSFLWRERKKEGADHAIIFIRQTTVGERSVPFPLS